MGKDPSSISIMIVGVIFALGFVQLLADTDKVHGKHKFCAEVCGFHVYMSFMWILLWGDQTTIPGRR